MHRDGIIAVARDRSAFHWFDDTFAELARYGFEGDLVHLDGDEARAAEPALGDAVGAATRMTIDRHVDPESLVRGLAARAGRVVEHAPVTAIARGRRGWRVRAGSRVAGGGGGRGRGGHGGSAAARAVRRPSCRSSAPRATRSRPAGHGHGAVVRALPVRAEARPLGARRGAPHRGLLRARPHRRRRAPGADPAAGRRHAAVPARLAPRARLGGDRLGRLPPGDARQPAADRRGRRASRACSSRPGTACSASRSGRPPAARSRSWSTGGVPDWVAPFAVDRAWSAPLTAVPLPRAFRALSMNGV